MIIETVRTARVTQPAPNEVGMEGVWVALVWDAETRRGKPTIKLTADDEAELFEQVRLWMEAGRPSMEAVLAEKEVGG